MHLYKPTLGKGAFFFPKKNSGDWGISQRVMCWSITPSREG